MANWSMMPGPHKNATHSGRVMSRFFSSVVTTPVLPFHPLWGESIVTRMSTFGRDAHWSYSRRNSSSSMLRAP